MLKTVDNKGQERFMSLVNFNRLPKNSDGSRGSNHVRRIEEIAEDAVIDKDLKDFIEKKKTITKPAITKEELITPILKEEIADEITGQVVEKKELVAPVEVLKKEDVIAEKTPVKKVAKRKTKKK
jgi:hypothetical protein